MITLGLMQFPACYWRSPKYWRSPILYFSNYVVPKILLEIFMNKHIITSHYGLLNFHLFYRSFFFNKQKSIKYRASPSRRRWNEPSSQYRWFLRINGNNKIFRVFKITFLYENNISIFVIKWTNLESFYCWQV